MNIQNLKRTATDDVWTVENISSDGNVPSIDVTEFRKPKIIATVGSARLENKNPNRPPIANPSSKADAPAIAAKPKLKRRGVTISNFVRAIASDDGVVFVDTNTSPMDRKVEITTNTSNKKTLKSQANADAMPSTSSNSTLAYGSGAQHEDGSSSSKDSGSAPKTATARTPNL